MAGGNEFFGKAIPMNSIGFFGLHIMTAGTYEGEMYEEKSDSTLKRQFTKDGLLKGFNQEIKNTAGTIKLCAGGISL